MLAVALANQVGLKLETVRLPRLIRGLLLHPDGEGPSVLVAPGLDVFERRRVVAEAARADARGERGRIIC